MNDKKGNVTFRLFLSLLRRGRRTLAKSRSRTRNCRSYRHLRMVIHYRPEAAPSTSLTTCKKHVSVKTKWYDLLGLCRTEHCVRRQVRRLGRTCLCFLGCLMECRRQTLDRHCRTRDASMAHQASPTLQEHKHTYLSANYILCGLKLS